MSRVVVTGAAGFIGSNLARALIARGHEVVGLDDLSSGSRSNLDDVDVRLVEGTILDQQVVEEVLRGSDSVVHLAAIGSVPRSVTDPWTTHRANVDGTLTVLQAAWRAGAGHVIFSSSSSVYGRNPVLPKHEREWVRPLSPYAVSKLAAEQYVLAHQESYGLETLALRLFNVFGPRQSAGHAYAAVIPRLVEAILGRQPATLYGDGEQTRDFTYVADVCATLVTAVERRLSAPEPVNLAFGTRTSLNELVRLLSGICGREVPVVHEEARAGDVRHSQAHGDRLRELVPGLTPTMMGPALKATVEWYRSIGPGR